VDIVSQKQKKLQCDVLRDIGQTVKCEVCTGIRQTVEDSSGYSVTETKEVTV